MAIHYSAAAKTLSHLNRHGKAGFFVIEQMERDSKRCNESQPGFSSRANPKETL